MGIHGIGRKSSIILGVFAMIAAVGGYTAYRISGEPSHKVGAAYSMFKTEPASIDTVSASVAGSGVVEAAVRVWVRADAQGRVVRLLAEPGSPVVKGQVLAELDNAEARSEVALCGLSVKSAEMQLSEAVGESRIHPAKVEAEVEQAVREVAEARKALSDTIRGAKPEDVVECKAQSEEKRIALDSAKSEMERAERLFQEGALTREALDSARLKTAVAEQQSTAARGRLESFMAPQDSNGLDAAKARLGQAVKGLAIAKGKGANTPSSDGVARARVTLAQARAALVKAQQTVAGLRITSPANGTLVSLAVGVGDIVAKDAVIAQVVDLSNLKVKMSIDEVDVPKTAKGQRVEIGFDSLDSEEVFAGTVSRVAEEGSNNNGVTLYDVWSRLDPQGVAGKGIRPGMNADVRIITEAAPGVVSIPRSALLERNGRNSVIVMKGGKPEYRRVRTGVMGDASVEIRRGVSVGESVVTNPKAGGGGF